MTHLDPTPLTDALATIHLLNAQECELAARSSHLALKTTERELWQLRVIRRPDMTPEGGDQLITLDAESRDEAILAAQKMRAACTALSQEVQEAEGIVDWKLSRSVIRERVLSGLAWERPDHPDLEPEPAKWREVRTAL